MEFYMDDNTVTVIVGICGAAATVLTCLIQNKISAKKEKDRFLLETKKAVYMDLVANLDKFLTQAEQKEKGKDYFSLYDYVVQKEREISLVASQETQDKLKEITDSITDVAAFIIAGKKEQEEYREKIKDLVSCMRKELGFASHKIDKRRNKSTTQNNRQK